MHGTFGMLTRHLRHPVCPHDILLWLRPFSVYEWCVRACVREGGRVAWTFLLLHP